MDHLSAALAAVADPTRRDILRRLSRSPATVGELAEPFRMSQQAVSKHLAVLERAGLVTKRRVGRRHVCTLVPAPLAAVADWAEEFGRRAVTRPESPREVVGRPRSASPIDIWEKP